MGMHRGVINGPPFSADRGIKSNRDDLRCTFDV